MEVRLVSRDSDLSKLCAEIIAEITRDHPWSFSTAAFEEAEQRPADLYVLDFETDASISDRNQWNYSNVVVLVQRCDVGALKNILGFEPNLVLKPANRATLSAILNCAISNCTVASLREDRDQMFQHLIEANLKLQEYDQNRTNFLTRVVHDFRTPLSTLSGYCGLLLTGPPGSLNDEQREIIQRMEYSAKRLAAMASAMVQLTVDRQLKRRPDLRQGDLRQAIEQALHEIRPFADDKRIGIKSEMASCSGSLYFERTQMNQVLVNILENACKFTPQKGLIEIRGYPFFWERRTGRTVAWLPRERRSRDVNEPNSYRLDICNSGPLLPREHLQTVFEEYTSYAGGTDRSAGGLGLAICKMIIDQHNGRIWAENSNTGPRFSFVLPIHRAGSTNTSTSNHHRQT